jgi:hypothetical protein
VDGLLKASMGRSASTWGRWSTDPASARARPRAASVSACSSRRCDSRSALRLLRDSRRPSPRRPLRRSFGPAARMIRAALPRHAGAAYEPCAGMPIASRKSARALDIAFRSPSPSCPVARNGREHSRRERTGRPRCPVSDACRAHNPAPSAQCCTQQSRWTWKPFGDQMGLSREEISHG